MAFIFDGKIGERIKQIRVNELRISQKELADKIDISTTLVQKIESGQVKNPGASVLFALANTLKTTPEYLLSGRGFYQTSTNTEAKIPILEWEEAKTWCTSDESRISSEDKKFVYHPVEAKKNDYFALRIHSPTMEGIFPVGSVVICQPAIDKKFNSGDVCLFYDETKDKAFVRQVVIDSKVYLRPLNKDFCVEELTFGMKTIAIIVASINLLDTSYQV